MPLTAASDIQEIKDMLQTLTKEVSANKAELLSRIEDLESKVQLWRDEASKKGTSFW